MYQLPHKLPNDLRLRILGNKEISGKIQNAINMVCNSNKNDMHQLHHKPLNDLRLRIPNNKEISGKFQNVIT